MAYQNPRVSEVADTLKQRLQQLTDKQDILKSVELKALFEELKTLEPDQKAAFGKEVNQLQAELRELVESARDESVKLPAIDVTAPFDINMNSTTYPQL